MKKFLSSMVAAASVLTAGIALAGPAQAATGSDVLGTYHDAAGRTVYYRNGTWNGSTGFGWQKISQKHKITSYNAIGFIAHNPDGGTAQGTDRLYMAYANEMTCTAGHCVGTDSIPVKLVVSYANVVSYYGVTINGTLGVKTAYCVNDDNANDCPSWVNGALRDSFAVSIEDDAQSGTTVQWSYKPLATLK